MLSLNHLLTFDIQNEYESAYDLSLNKNFSNPKIYNAGGDLTKRWYVYFSFRDPSTGKMKRVTPIYGKANKFNNKEDRLTILTVYRKKLLQLLKQGYDPFGDNSELYLKNTTTQLQSKVLNSPINKEVATLLLKKNRK